MKKSKKNFYQEFSRADKILDLLLIIAVVSGIILVMIELSFSTSQKFSAFVRTADLFLVSVCLLDMGRTFFKSKKLLNFFQHHWLDLVILGVVIISFSTLLYVGTGRLSWLLKEEKVFAGLGRFFELGFLRRILSL